MSAEKDIYDEQVEKLLPCKPECGRSYDLPTAFHHVFTCPDKYRPAVAAALRKLREQIGAKDAEIAELRKALYEAGQRAALT